MCMSIQLYTCRLLCDGLSHAACKTNRTVVDPRPAKGGGVRKGGSGKTKHRASLKWLMFDSRVVYSPELE